MYPKRETPKENERRAVAESITQSKRIGEKGGGFVDNRPESSAQIKLQKMADDSEQVRQLSLYSDLFNQGSRTGKALQLQPGDDPDYEPEKEDSPSGYAPISAHSTKIANMDHIYVKMTSGGWFLWWQPDYRNDMVSNFKMTGSRSSDKTKLGNQGGLTWHHCGDYSNGKCTMQQVLTSEHENIFHYGAVHQWNNDSSQKYFYGS